MSTVVTKHMAKAYVQEAPQPMALSGFFTADPRNYYTSETIEFDIEREGEEIAPVLTDIKNGATKFALDQYTNKEFKAPVMKEQFSINAFDMMKRQFDQNTFASSEFRANAMTQFMKHMRYGGKRQRRTMELMASQILQTATVTLKDELGADVYTIDFKPKATHFPTFAQPWTDPALARPFDDIKSLCDVINTDGQSTPSQVWLGDGAYNAMINSEQFQTLADNRRINIVNIAPASVPNGAIYMGTLVATGYRLDLFTYRGEFKDIGASTNSRYLDDNAVLIIAEGYRFDATFGSIPQIVPPESRAMSFLTGRMPMSSVGMDFTTNAYVSLDGESITGSLASRCLMIPTAIDRFGCGRAF